MGVQLVMNYSVVNSVNAKRVALMTGLLFNLIIPCVWAEEPVSNSVNCENQSQDNSLQANPLPTDPSPTHHSQNNTQIDDIDINIHPVFDENNPNENNWIFRAVNFLHIATHQSTVKNDLLFKEGDSYDEKLIKESERRLRTRPYINNVSVKANPDCAGNTKVKVDVHEVWTLLPEFTFSHAGSSSHTGYGIHDSNFLGLGKTVNVVHSSNTDRTGNIFEYVDPNTNIADSMFSYYYADNDDGVHKTTQFVKPFAALSSDWSAGGYHEDYSEQDTLYNQGEEANRFGHLNTNYTFFYGIKLPFSSRDSIHRLLVGYTHWEDEFFAVPVATNPINFVPDNRQFNYPWVEYQHIDDSYVQAYNIQQINRVEDINLGSQVRVRLGYTQSRYDFFNHNLTFSGDFSQAFALSDNQMILTQLFTKGFYDHSEFYNTVVSGIASYHWKNFNRGQFYIGVTESRGFKLFGDLPLELGGDTGLRGYPIRYQAGDHLELLTIEQRYFDSREWFSLFHVGAAVFYDEGRAWGNAIVPQLQTNRLRDWGFGLRFSGTRTGNRDEGTHNIVHFDLAFPMDGDPSIKNVQWLVKVKQSF